MIKLLAKLFETIRKTVKDEREGNKKIMDGLMDIVGYREDETIKKKMRKRNNAIHN